MTDDSEVAATFLRVAATRYRPPQPEQIAEWEWRLTDAGVTHEVAEQLADDVIRAGRELAELAAKVAEAATKLLAVQRKMLAALPDRDE